MPGQTYNTCIEGGGIIGKLVGKYNVPPIINSHQTNIKFLILLLRQLCTAR